MITFMLPSGSRTKDAPSGMGQAMSSLWHVLMAFFKFGHIVESTLPADVDSLGLLVESGEIDAVGGNVVGGA